LEEADVKNLVARAGVASLLGLAALTPMGRALAQENPSCDAIAGAAGPVVYGIGGSAQTPLIGRIASKLAGAAAPVTIVYSDAGGACKAVEALDPNKPASERLVTGAAWYWAAGNNSSKPCNLPAAGVNAAFGSMQQFPEFCPYFKDLSAAEKTAFKDGVGGFKGPVGTVNVIVPKQSSQNSISADAFYFVFGFGEQGKVEPWVENEYIFHRNANSAVQLYLAAATGLPDAFNPNVGTDAGTNPNSINWVGAGGVHPNWPATGEVLYPAVTVPNFEATIGFVSGENADNNRDKVRTLAYQHRGQDCGYWPDSTPTSFDKINVRTGKYFLWGDVLLYAAIDDDRKIVDENARDLIGYVTGEVEAPSELPILDVFIDNGNIPRCAMQVQRTEDLGEVTPFEPEEPCGCYFESRVNGRTSCESCDDSDECPSEAPVCRRGYCEVR
jgi:hypothetical protein